MSRDPNATGNGIGGRIDVHARILQHVSDAVIAVDNDRMVTYMNPAAERQYSGVAAEAMGQPLNTVYQVAWVKETDETDAMRARGTSIFIRVPIEERHEPPTPGLRA